jgi:serine/threonine-protein kinase
MAPEQVERPMAVDHRADIYSLGVVFYEMLTGELPMGRFQPPSHKVHVDVRIDDVVLRALEKEPDRRYQRASHVKTELESAAPPLRQSSLPPPKPTLDREGDEIGGPAHAASAIAAALCTRPPFLHVRLAVSVLTLRKLG